MTTHCCAARPPPSERWIVGRATFTTVPSSSTMLEPMMHAASVRRLRVRSSDAHEETAPGVRPPQPRTSSAAVRSVLPSPEISSVVTIDSRQRSSSSRIFSARPDQRHLFDQLPRDLGRRLVLAARQVQLGDLVDLACS